MAIEVRVRDVAFTIFARNCWKVYIRTKNFYPNIKQCYQVFFTKTYRCIKQNYWSVLSPDGLRLVLHIIFKNLNTCKFLKCRMLNNYVFAVFLFFKSSFDRHSTSTCQMFVLFHAFTLFCSFLSPRDRSCKSQNIGNTVRSDQRKCRWCSPSTWK
jgi:hypothetical protein